MVQMCHEINGFVIADELRHRETSGYQLIQDVLAKRRLVQVLYHILGYLLGSLVSRSIRPQVEFL